MAEPVLETSGLYYRTAEGAILIEDASLCIRRGEIVAVAGPNGAGKSTLLKLLAGLLAPTSGSIRLFGEPAPRLSAKDRAQRIAFVSQREDPDPRLRVWDYVALGRIPHRWRSARAQNEEAIATALSAVGLNGFRDARLGLLSGGEMQRAALARGLCQRPDLLFLDEPTNHLDPKAKGHLLSLIADLGITILSVVHDISLISSFASHAVLVDSARIVASGPTETTVTRDMVRRVFGVDYLQLKHPELGHSVAVLDIGITRASNPESTAL